MHVFGISNYLAKNWLNIGLLTNTVTWEWGESINFLLNKKREKPQIELRPTIIWLDNHLCKKNLVAVVYI